MRDEMEGFKSGTINDAGKCQTAGRRGFGVPLSWDAVWVCRRHLRTDTISTASVRQVPPSLFPTSSPSPVTSALFVPSNSPENAGTRAFDGRRFFSSPDFLPQANYFRRVLFHQSGNRL